MHVTFLAFRKDILIKVQTCPTVLSPCWADKKHFPFFMPCKTYFSNRPFLRKDINNNRTNHHFLHGECDTRVSPNPLVFQFANETSFFKVPIFSNKNISLTELHNLLPFSSVPESPDYWHQHKWTWSIRKNDMGIKYSNKQLHTSCDMVQEQTCLSHPPPQGKVSSWCPPAAKHLLWHKMECSKCTLWASPRQPF